MRFFLFIAVLVFAVPVWAQDNVIRVINDDGSVTEIDLSVSPEPVVPKKIETLPIKPPKPAVVAPEVVKDIPFQKPLPPKVSAPQKKIVKKVAKKSIVVPGRKPLVPYRLRPLYEIPEPVRPAGVEISSRQAVSVALQYAPPSRGFDVERRSYQGQSVFAVMFKTETGRQDVLIDAMSGDFITVQKHGASKQRAPGVLPVH